MDKQIGMDIDDSGKLRGIGDIDSRGKIRSKL